MPKKLMFYNIFLYRGDKRTDYPIYQFLDDVIQINTEGRFKLIKKKHFKLNALEADNNKNTYNRDLWFCKYREDKPFVGNILTDDTDPIESDVIEPTVFTLIPDSFLLLSIFNNFGPSYKMLEKYLNSFININNENTPFEKQLKIKIDPIKTKDQMDLVKNADHIKNIDIEFRIDDVDFSKLINDNYDDKSIIVETMAKNAEVSEKLDSQIGTLRLKKGRFKEPIDMSKALALFNSIKLEEDDIRSVKVTIKNKKGKDRNIDLKHKDNLYEYLDIDGNDNGFDYLRMKIREEYYGNLNRLANKEFTKKGSIEELIYENLIKVEE